MTRVLGYLTAWLAATAVAIALVWFGVRDLVHGTGDTPLPSAPLGPAVALGEGANAPVSASRTGEIRA